MSPRENPFDMDDNKSTIDLVFKVWAPRLNRMTHRLYLLGSLKQMGAWNILAAVQAFPTSDFHTWRVDVRDVPINTTFEWSWVKAKPNRSDVKWERMVKRNRTVDCFGGVVHTIYGDGEEVFVQSATYAEVSTYRKVEQGQVLVMTGSSFTTGFWDLDKAIKATEYPRLSGYWKVQVAFDSSCSLQFKWAIITEYNRKLHLLEKESHVLYGRQTWLRVVAPWNVSRVFIEDTPICLEPLDHVTGRTDVLVNAKKTHTESIRQWLQSDSKIKPPTLVPISHVPTLMGAPSYPKSTPRHTNEEKAKEALKAFMAMSDLDTDKLLLGIGGGPISSRVPTVQPLENVDDHVKKRSQETKGRTDRHNKQQENERNPFKTGLAIKGKGQTLVAKSSATEMMKEQAMVDATLMSLVHVTEKEPEDQGHLQHADSEASTSSATTAVSGATTLSTNRMTRFHSQQDLMLEKMEELKSVIRDIETDPVDNRKGLPTIERDISLIVTHPPPTWSMLQEAEMMKTCNPILPTSNKSSRSKEVIKPPAPTPSPFSLFKKLSLGERDSGSNLSPMSLSRHTTSLESFKPRTPLLGTSRGKPFIMTPGTGKEPSSVGMDDTMKSPSELKLEQANRRVWEKRSALP